MSNKTMSKKMNGNLNKRINGDAHIKLLKTWLQTVQLCDEQSEKLISSIFKAVKSSLAGSISASCGNSGGILTRDEEIYDCYKRLMSRYSDLAKRYMETRHFVSTTQTDAILNGIYSVIISRLQISDENKMLYDNANQGINPIFVEKKEILAGRIKTFSKNFDAIANKFYNENQRKIFQKVREEFANGMGYKEAIKFSYDFSEKMLEACMPDFYQCYSAAVKSAAMCLNDLDVRKELSFYVDILRQEKQILSDISYAQLPAINELLKSPAVSDDEKNVIFGFVYILNDASERLNNEIDNLAVFFRWTAENSRPYECQIEDYEMLLFNMLEVTESEKLLTIQAFDEVKRQFDLKFESFFNMAVEEVYKTVEQSISIILSGKHKYHFNKMIHEEQLMAKEMCTVFKELHEYYASNFSDNNVDNNVDSNDAEIISGIDETIRIKLEAISEANDIFVADVNKSISNFASDIPFDSDKYLEKSKNAVKGFISKLCFVGKDERNGLSILLRYLQDSSNDIVAEYEKETDKAIRKYGDIVNKKIIRFEKEHLLYEMSTFEEILNYSVSRLRASENNFVAGYVAFIDKETEILFKILQKNGIDILRPVPHDIFNGKEHEVLIAEANKDFKKGEIIKLMNNGYKKGDVVLIRANVIAAR